ncbi:Uncharacterised protein [Kurthia zopfii]|nr:Uncharacterised protein [Kurthia zopfii]
MNFKEVFYFFVGMLLLLLAGELIDKIDHIIPICIVIVSVFYENLVLNLVIKVVVFLSQNLISYEQERQ